MIALGIDSGANTAWAIVEVPRRNFARMVFVAAGMFARQDRAGQVRAMLLGGYGIECIGIEHAPKIVPRKRFGSPMATHISEGNAIAAELANEARHCGFEPQMMTAGEWRKALIGKANATNQQIAEWMRNALGGVVAIKTNEHQRDGFGTAVHAAKKVMSNETR